MRINRIRQSKKNLKIYVSKFGFKAPYQVVLDLRFVDLCIKHHLNIKDQLARYLSGEVELITTKCVVQAAKKFSPKELKGDETKNHANGLLKVLSGCKRFYCPHRNPNYASHEDCIKYLIGDNDNNKHLFLATQSKRLQQFCEDKIVPMIHLSQNVIILEPPGSFAKKEAVQLENELLQPSVEELRRIGINLNTAEKRPKKKRKPKIAQTQTATTTQTTTENTQRKPKNRKKKIKLSQHIVKALAQQ